MSIEEKYCSECPFWDYEKKRCSEWFRHEIPNDSLHRCEEAYKSKIEKLSTIQSTDYEQGYHDGFVDGMNYRKSRNGYGG